MNFEVLDAMFRPKSVAVVGASSQPGKIGYTVLDNLLKGGYQGKIYPINPKADEILGLKVYPAVANVPDKIDAAIITVPSKLTLQSIEECGKKGIKGLIVITSGFSEVGDHDLEHKITEVANQYGARILGPNIVGTLSNSDKFNGSFAPFLPLVGKGALITQSGALLIAIDAATYVRRIGFDKLISIGNMCDVDFADTIFWLGQDANTSCISLYIEGLRDGRRFMESVRAANKPVVALKSGVSEHGAAAAASHTGSLAGGAKLYSAAFQQCGVIQAADLDNLLDRVQVLSMQPPMKGENVLVLTNGGGVGVLATDAAEKYGIPLKFAPADVQAEFRKHMPEFGSAKNPVDLTGGAGNDWYIETTRYALTHSWVDGLVVLYCETAMTNPQEIAQSIKKGVEKSGLGGKKPITVSFVGGERSAKAMQWLVENGIPAYGAPDVAVNAMAALREYARVMEAAHDPVAQCIGTNQSAARAIIAQARASKRNSLTEVEAKEVFAAYGLPVAKTILAINEDEAVKLAEKIGYPVVMKIVSPDILHKSDAGGVKVNVKDEKSVREAFRTIMANAKAYKADANIYGIAVQEMAPWGTEVILGSVNDATFGPTIMFGLGGIFVEVLKDVTFRVTPVSATQASMMLNEIRGAKILSGVRGEKPRDKKAMVDTICRYAAMIHELGDEISESDANPVLLYEEGKGIKVVDARIILKKK